jgi:DNA-binding NtrC family response regulator
MSGIVIYEEDDLMSGLLQEWLSAAGYAVRAASPNERQRGGAADLVIASVYMPRHAGLHLVREIQAAHPGTPLIAISGQFRSGLSAIGATAETLAVQLLHQLRGVLPCHRVSGEHMDLFDHAPDARL